MGVHLHCLSLILNSSSCPILKFTYCSKCTRTKKAEKEITCKLTKILSVSAEHDNNFATTQLLLGNIQQFHQTEQGRENLTKISTWQTIIYLSNMYLTIIKLPFPIRLKLKIRPEGIKDYKPLWINVLLIKYPEKFKECTLFCFVVLFYFIICRGGPSCSPPPPPSFIRVKQIDYLQ